MLRNLLLPLAITASLINAGAANTFRTAPFTRCAIAPSGANSLIPAENRTKTGRRSPSGMTRFETVQRFPQVHSDSSRPYMVAALGIEPAPLPANGPSSCYPPLSFATSSVPSAMAGTHYTVALSANGGQPPYSWSFGRSALPPGFAVDASGNLTGTPEAAGSYPFNVVVSDSLKNNVTGALTLTVASAVTQPPSPPPPTQPPPTQPPPTQPPPTQPPPTQPPPTQPPPTQPPPPPTQPPPTPVGTALTACGNITQSGPYYLANDVSSAGTCFGIDANNVTLNLNGHTITYDTGGLDFSPAIEAHDCWSTTNPVINGPCGSAHGGMEIYGGNIVQTAGPSTFSHVFEFGQGSFRTAPYIHDITATFQNTGAQFYFSRYLPAGAKIENNTIYDNVTSINHVGQGDLSARSAFQGQAIYIGQNRNNPSVGDLISGNKIVGSPQGGAYSDNQYTTISGNDISMNSDYSNDFCAAMPADHQTAQNNNCHPRSGRGFHANANYDTISNNVITVTELPQNMEYGKNGQPGCEGGGAYGVQVEYDSKAGSANPPVGIQITGNTITATAADCDAIGLRASSMTPAATAVFSGNSVTTSNSGGTGLDYALSVDALDGSGLTYSGNTFQSMYSYGSISWNGSTNVTVGHNTWAGTPVFSVIAGDGGCDPSQVDSVQACPVSFTMTDALPNGVKCGTYSEATVTIGTTVTICKAAH